VTGVSVIVPARDAAPTIGATLAGLERQQFAGPFEVIVVDDGSRDATAEIASRSKLMTRVLSGEGRGPAHARNTGADAARGEALAFIDADCSPTPGWLAAGTSALRHDTIVLGQTRPPPDEQLGPFDRTLWVTCASPLHESANLFVDRSLFQRLHGFESWLRPRAGKELAEDVWFGWRARRAGFSVGYCPDALAYHAIFPRTAAGFVAERWRLRFFPEMARRIPELRDALFYRRWFLSRRSAAFDMAAAGAVAALLRRAPLTLTAAIPYALLAGRDALEDGGVEVAAALLAADFVGAAAMVYGSVRSRSLLL
jgi:glycosyltransferase involved in cell wall biosynthesis